jgi:nucleotide-binding universal stress UspA family protein
MNYILATTDFSKVSENAVQYAAQLAASLQMELVILHSFSFPVMVSDLPLPSSLIDDTRGDAKEKMETISASLSATLPGLQIATVIEYGSFAEVVNQFTVTRGNPWIITLGNSNLSEDTSWLFSTLRDAATDLAHSLLAIPEQATFKPISRICLAVDAEQPANKTALKKLTDIHGTLQCELHVLSIEEALANRYNTPEIDEETRAELAVADPHYHFSYEADVDETIKKYCTEQQADVLALIKGTYSFLEGLFHKSHTRVLASSMEIPILLLHEEV